MTPEPAARDDLLRLDYTQTTELVRTLADARFKLLALVPTLSGAAVGLLHHPDSAIELLAVGLLGLAATLGVLLHELRNGRLHDYAVERARRLEAALGLPGGLFSERPERTLRLRGLGTVDRDGGPALVYGAALGGWAYLVAWGVLRALDVGAARSVGGAIGAGVGLLVVAELARSRERTSGAREARPAAERVRAV